MKENSRIRASIAPAPPVFPPAPARGLLGLLMLDTRFPRPPGDVGHPDAWGRPVCRRVVPGAWPRSVVQSAEGLRAGGLQPLFLEAARELQEEGVAAIASSCGFLVLLQQELQAAVRVPVATSSLLLLPALLACEAQVGVLTIDAASLGHEHLLAAGVPGARLEDVIVQGVDPHGEFAASILGNQPTMDLEAAECEVVTAAVRLKQRAPGLGTLVLECTNMPPYAQAIRDATGFVTRSIFDLPQLQDAP